jgi:hypothetical protein
MQDDERPAESDEKTIEARPPAPPHKFFFGRGVTPEQMADMLLAEYESRTNDRTRFRSDDRDT